MIGSPLAGALGPLGVGQARGIPTPGAYWKMDEASGNRLDSIGSNHLIPTGTPAQIAGKVGNAVRFPGSGTTVLSAPAASPLDGGGDVSLTIALWIRLNSKANSRNFLGKGTGTIATALEYRFRYDQPVDRFRWQVSRTAAVTTVDADTLGSPSTGVWYFVVCYHNAAEDRIGIRVNAGTADTAVHGGTGIHTTAAEFQVGNFTGIASADADIDELGLWRVALSDAHISSLYNSGNGRTYPFS